MAATGWHLGRGNTLLLAVLPVLHRSRERGVYCVNALEVQQMQFSCAGLLLGLTSVCKAAKA